MSALALRSNLWQCESAEEVAAGPAACGGADRGVGAVFADGFSVEDLLDLEDLCEVDKDCAELLGDAAPSPDAVEEDKLSSDSHGSSVVSYELTALPVTHPVIDLPLPVRANRLLTSSFAGKAASLFFSPLLSLSFSLFARVPFPRLGC